MLGKLLKLSDKLKSTWGFHVLLITITLKIKTISYTKRKRISRHKTLQIKTSKKMLEKNEEESPWFNQESNRLMLRDD